MGIDFIHIGLIKTASTYMQNIWANDPAYTISWQVYGNQINALRNDIRKGKDSGVVLKLETNKTSFDNLNVVVSHEGFSSSFINEPKYQPKMLKYIEIASKKLKEIDKANENILIVVREPLSWIKSVYIQSIKQGGFGTAQDFIDQQDEFIMNALNLRWIINEYSKYFDNILVLPYELFKHDEKTFFDIISYTFDTQPVTIKIKERLNQSLSSERVQALSHLNRQSHFMIESLATSDTYKNTQEKIKLLTTHNNTSKWVYRRFLEYCTNEEYVNFCKENSIVTDDKEFFEYRLPSHLVQMIQDNYIDYLMESITPEYPKLYLDKFNEYLEQTNYKV